MLGSLEDNRVEMLVGLGLTHNQARVYLSSLQTGCASVKLIAQFAQIGREDVYRIMPALQDLGLIRKHIGTPTLYEPVAPNEAMSILMGKKTGELSQLKSKVQLFLKNWRRIDKPIEKDESFILVTNFDIAIHMLVDAIRKTKKSWLFSTGYERFIIRQNMPKKCLQINEMYKAVQRGVKIQAVLDEPQSREKLPGSLFGFPSSRALIKHKNFEYKYLSSKHVGLLSIFDDNLIFIETQQGPRIIVPQLWSNNHVLLGLGKTCFDQAWNNAYFPE